MAKSYKILVVSDTHGENGLLKKVVSREKPLDLLIHCGDVQGDLQDVLKGESFPCWAVKGNCDPFRDLPEVLTLRIGSSHLMITHGHKLDVKYSRRLLLYEAGKNHADIVLYGHTHIPEVRRDAARGLLVVNPGSLTFPGQFPRVPTYAVLTIPEEGEPEAVIRKAGK